MPAKQKHRSLPHRQLRNAIVAVVGSTLRSLPHRQLRNAIVAVVVSTLRSLPHRQLRNAEALAAG